MAGSALAPPKRVQTLITSIGKDATMHQGLLAMKEREAEFSSPLAAKLAGIAVVPEARAEFNRALNAMWAKDSAKKITDHDEVIVGGGLHAAIYCAVRAEMGFPKPLVIEASDTVGGAFAVSQDSSFYLNSRNRPGNLTLPGKKGALNVIPAGPVQPSDLSGDEYQRNTDLAFAIRCTLAMHADVVAGRAVLGVEKGATRNHAIVIGKDFKDTETIQCDRVIIATGLGDPTRLTTEPTKRILSFPEFMCGLDQDFPLRGMGRVAVVGAGDSGRTVIEALTGQGPSSGWSVAALDYVDEIDWYGVDADALTRKGWEACNRSRYQGIARLLPREFGGRSRVLATDKRGETVASGFQCAYVNEVPYDFVVNCTGFQRRSFPVNGDLVEKECRIDGRPVAQRLGVNIFVVGPAAEIPVSPAEASAIEAVAQIPENSTSLFRYAGRTATLASCLPEPERAEQAEQIVTALKNKKGKGSKLKTGAFQFQTPVAFATTASEISLPVAIGTEPKAGEFIGLTDKAGREIRAGYIVEVEGSSRFGKVRGIVTGKTGRDRVAIKLDGGKDDNYSSSRGRVRVL